METHTMIAVIGGGAAGFMAAITAAENNPNAKVIIFEKGPEVLNKVRISGGGRCNVTHNEPNPKKLSHAYPRGAKFLLKLFNSFNAIQTIDWFEKRGIELKTEKDGRMFPITNSSETIVNCLWQAAKKSNVEVRKSCLVKSIAKIDELTFQLELINHEFLQVNKIIYATGGSPSINGYSLLKNLNINILPPVPSLFTFHLDNTDIINLSGVSVQNASVKVGGQKLQTDGPLLITHWGASGPAILKLSAWGARYFAEQNYKCQILINFISQIPVNKVIDEVNLFKKNNFKKIITSNPMFDIPGRLWSWFCEYSGIEVDLKWLDVSLKKQNKLIESLTNFSFQTNGKSTFKEEFVTCGGVDLEEIDNETMESKRIKGLFFAGEVLNIDAVTGGYNFQAAWTTGYIAGKSVLKN
jgi:predicted Rossmann fold flavoprotein